MFRFTWFYNPLAQKRPIIGSALTTIVVSNLYKICPQNRRFALSLSCIPHTYSSSFPTSRVGFYYKLLVVAHARTCPSYGTDTSKKEGRTIVADSRQLTPPSCAGQKRLALVLHLTHSCHPQKGFSTGVL